MCAGDELRPLLIVFIRQAGKADSTYYEAVRRARIAFDFAIKWRSDSSVVFVPVFHRFETAGL